MSDVCIITGGSGGIGFECAKMFKNSKVLISARSRDKLELAVNELKKSGVDAYFEVCDIKDKQDVEKLFKSGSKLGDIKTFINCAGVSGVGHDAISTFEIDLCASLNIIKASMEHLQKNSVLILISSMMGHMVPPNEAYDVYLREPDKEGALEALKNIAGENADTAYNFSKRGVILLAEKYAKSFGEKSMRILSVSPGIIMTEMAIKAAQAHPEVMKNMENMTPLKRNGTPKDIAEAVYFLSSDKASFISGTDILIDGGLTLALKEVYAKK